MPPSWAVSFAGRTASPQFPAKICDRFRPSQGSREGPPRPQLHLRLYLLREMCMFWGQPNISSSSHRSVGLGVGVDGEAWSQRRDGGLTRVGQNGPGWGWRRENTIFILCPKRGTPGPEAHSLRVEPRPLWCVWFAVCLHSRVSVSLCARPCARVGYLYCRARSSDVSEDGVNVCV